MAYQKTGTELEIRLASSITRPLGVAAHIMSSLRQRFAEERQRDEIRQLLQAEDWVLRDMGISRDDVKTAILLPLDQSAGKHLEAIRKRKNR